MASIINASSTGSGGIVQTADASGVLQLQSNGTVVLTVNTSNQMVLGATGGSVSGSNSVGKESIYKPIDALSVPFGTRMIDLYAYYPGFENANPSATVFAGVDASTSTQNGYVAFQTLNAGTLSEAFRVSQYGTAVLKGGTVNAGGVGVCFPATQDASSNANTLDDYEEGTWTPTYSTTGATITYAFQSGSYIKIGRMVYVTWDLGTASVTITDGSAQVNVGGLPFTASGSVASNGIVNQANNWASNNPNCCLVAVGASVMQIGPTNFIQNSASYCSYLNTTTAQRNETHGTLMYYANS